MDSAVLQKMIEGDAESFRIVVLESQRPLFSFIVKFVADETVAEDLLQETYLRIWKNRRRYKLGCNFLTWALSIAANVSKDYLRRSFRLGQSSFDETLISKLLSPDPETECALTNREWASVIRSIVMGMGQKQRLIFTLSCLEGYDNDEIREITGMSPTQIKSNLYVAKQILRKRLNEMGYE